MPKPAHLTLGAYVRRRNGVPLGHRDSLRNMLQRSLGAESFHVFWLYWNPIWGYALARWVAQPLQRFLPAALSLWLTFVVSGAVHDFAASLIKRHPIVVLTPWFALMGLLVLASKFSGYSLRHAPWAARAALNLGLIVASFWLSRQLV